MPSFTKEQLDAINREGSNIIVSAGAGSGKTAVLTARVIRKLKDGIDVNKLLVLTFTNEAAGEMKDRIRKSIKKEINLKDQLNYIDSAYITTFDSYALSVVKKYHYLLNISNNISIVDSSIINIKKEDFIDEIFNNLYEKQDENFLKFIADFCMKDDKEIKKYILNINSSLELIYNKEEYLSDYISHFYSEKYIDFCVNNYLELIYSKVSTIKSIYEDILTIEDSKKCEEYSLSLTGLVSAKDYTSIKNSLDISLPRIVKNSKEEKEKIKELISELKDFTIYSSIDEMKFSYLSTKDYVSVIISIIKKLDQMVLSYKSINDSFEFIDISKMAIKVVKENEEVRSEIKYYYNEIMVDEYQDTNDLQEMFINLIENNNLYMVGDVKQSIYRFRNANPLIFKNKYDLYSTGSSGIKIDLLKNFRSREEVLADINKIFNKIMDDFLGGADYIKTHQMVFGNTIYDEYKMEDKSNFLEIYNYDPKENISFSKTEKEAFIIAKDIKKKIKNNYKIFDKKTGEFRKASYNDFCIIMDRGTDFDLYKKIFEYENVPLVMYKDEVLTNEYDVFIIKNLISLIIKIKNNKFDQEFKYYFTSIARSYLFSLEDNYILEIFKDNKFKETNIYKLALEISKNLDNISCHEFLYIVLDKFNFYEKCLSYRDVEKTMIRILYLQKLSKSLGDLGYTPYMFGEYLTHMIKSDSDIKYKLNTKDETSVKIMNIHKSKGLEFPICYYSGLYKKFNMKDMNERFSFDNKYGIITPYKNNGIGNVFIKSLVKEKYIKEEISEKIRLFYVGLTRAKEKMVFVCPLDDNIYNDEEIVNDNTRLKYRSFLDMVNTIKDNFDVNTKSIDFEGMLSKNYNLYKKKDFSFLNDSNKIVKKNVSILDDVINDKKFSKVNNTLKNKEELDSMKFGTDIHYLFQISDFKSSSDNVYINNFLNQNLLKNASKAEIYKEYEFLYEDKSNIYHGVIDLMLCYDDHIDIIDYKLSNIDDDNYKKQLSGYKDYIANKTGKEVKTYLYSIKQDIMKEV